MMRRNQIIGIRAVLLVFLLPVVASCQLDFLDGYESFADEPVEVGIKAGGGIQTRTIMFPNGLSAAWDSNDELAVWAKNSSGSYILAKQIFKTYGVNDAHGFFTSTLASSMPEGDYTYLCCYPEPLSVNGTSVTFDLPAVQDGKASGGADIMIADPSQFGPLAPIADPDGHSTLSLKMNRIMHQFRFWIPDGYYPIGEPIDEIIITMPQNIAGTVTADISNPSAGVSLSNGKNVMRLKMTDGLGASSSLDNATFACAAVFPSNGIYTAMDYMNLVVYSKKYKAVLEPISLSGRTFLAGHSTPVTIMPTEFVEYYRLTMNVDDNFIGEPLSNVTISFNGLPWYTYTNSSAEGYGNFSHSVEALGAEGKEAYELLVNSINEGVATYTYETKHALVTRPLTADMMKYDGNQIVLELGDVPYLIYEDFTNAKSIAHDDDYTPGANSDRNLQGYLLDGYLPLNGWNAARFQVFEGDCVRINSRYESGAWVVGRYCGRLDTPAISYLKPNVSVDVILTFDNAFYVPAGYNRDDSKEKKALYHIGTHTNPQSSPLDGENSNDISGKISIVYTSDTHASEDVSILKETAVAIKSVTSSTRITFFMDTTRETSVIAANACYYLYLDNIKLQIK
jgi:hypothetical protein